jgi:hypothetical protein
MVQVWTSQQMQKVGTKVHYFSHSRTKGGAAEQESTFLALPFRPLPLLNPRLPHFTVRMPRRSLTVNKIKELRALTELRHPLGIVVSLALKQVKFRSCADRGGGQDASLPVMGEVSRDADEA